LWDKINEEPENKILRGLKKCKSNWSSDEKEQNELCKLTFCFSLHGYT
jgi:hypothetical protein